METGEELVSYCIVPNRIDNIAATGCESGDIILHRVESGKLVHLQSLKHHKAAVFDCIFSEDRLYSCSYDGNVVIWKKLGEQYQFERSISVFSGAINSICAIKDKIICGCSDGNIRVLSKEGDTQKEEFAHRYGVTSVSANDKYLVSSGMDGLVKVWSLEDISLLTELKDHTGVVRDCKVSINPYSTFVFATCSDDGTVIVYTEKTNAKEGEKEKEDQDTLRLHKDIHKLDDQCYRVSWSKAGYALAVGISNGTIKTFKPKSSFTWKETSTITA
ncbi:protein transport protein SEC13 [Nematocida sp. AWRm80]|nr:protein transport protein SEC13 [Nematocida sp. AWRm80]